MVEQGSFGDGGELISKVPCKLSHVKLGGEDPSGGVKVTL